MIDLVPVVTEVGMASDFFGPIGIEERRRGGAVRQREFLARRPRPAAKVGFQPVVGKVKPVARLCHAIGIALTFGPDRVGHRLLQIPHHVDVEKAV